MRYKNVRTVAAIWLALTVLLILGGGLPHLAHANPLST